MDEEEAKRDMTYQEFLAKYQDHIEGKAEFEGDRNRPITAEGNESKDDG